MNADSDQPEPTRGRRWRVKVWMPIAALLVGLVVTYLVWPTADPPPVEQQTEAIVDVQVVEHGFTIYPNEDTYWEDGVGYVVENFGNRVAMAEVEYWFVDSNGEAIGR